MRLRGFFGKLRGKFLLFFTMGMVATLAVISVVHYSSTYRAFHDLNDEIVSAEFSQISAGVNAFLQNLEQTVDAEFLTNGDAVLLTQYEGDGYLPYLGAVNRLKETVRRLTLAFPYIESVSFYIGDERIVSTSQTSTRELGRDDAAWPSERVRAAMARPTRSFALLGGVFWDEMPLRGAQTPHEPLVVLYKSLYIRRKVVTCAVNLYESQLYGFYGGLSSDRLRKIRLLTPDGTIVSSADKSEIGALYGLLDPGQLAEAGRAVVGGEDLSQAVWKPINGQGLTILVDTSMRPYTDMLSALQVRVVLIFLAGMLVTCAAFFLWMNRILRPLDQLILGMRRAGAGDYAGKLGWKGQDEFSILTQQYNHMLDDLRRFEDDRRAKDAELREAELLALRNQINPHFLYNTLNVVRWMARFSGADGIETCVSALGGLVMPLYKDGRPTCSLRAELELLDKYLVIMNLRYNGTIDFRREVPAELLDTEIPRFILQPLVENSIQHGRDAGEAGCRITLRARLDQDMLALSVEDEGAGMPPSELEQRNAALAENAPSEGVGIGNVNRRVRLRYGPWYGVRLEANEPRGLRAVIRLPRREHGEPRPQQADF